MISKLAIIKMIYIYALHYGVDPDVAISVATVESNLNTNMVGSKGEIGLFQIHPKWTKYSVEQLKNTKTNIRVGIKKLKEAKNICPFQENLTWTLCYNFGYGNAKRVKHPELFPYVLKVTEEYNKRLAGRQQTMYYMNQKEY